MIEEAKETKIVKVFVSREELRKIVVKTNNNYPHQTKGPYFIELLKLEFEKHIADKGIKILHEYKLIINPSKDEYIVTQEQLKHD